MVDPPQLRQRRAQAAEASADPQSQSQPPRASTSASMGSPRFNAFRAAAGSEMESQLLFREQPRQIAVLALAAAAFSLSSFSYDAQDARESVRRGLAAGVLLFLVYCFLQTRDGLMVRPHPGIWRVVHGCSVVYLLLLAAVAVQDREGAIHALQFIFPEVGDVKRQTTPGKLECEINAKARALDTRSLYRGVSSIWFLAHVAGWWGKMCMFRDWRVCWVLSVAFELLELALQFVIPDFQECWWDSLLMDLLGANILGMLLGRATLWLCRTKEYDWSGKKGKKVGYMRQALRQFTPISWQQYHWEVFSSFSRFAQVVFAIIVCLVTELNAFFLLTSLAIPKESKFNSYRLALIFLIGIPATAEYYEFLSNPECGRLGQNSWMILSISVFEVLVWLKFSGHGVLFPASPPPVVLFAIVAFLLLFSLWVVLFFSAKKKTPKRDSRVTRWGWLDVLFWASFTPLALLTTQWAF